MTLRLTYSTVSNRAQAARESQCSIFHVSPPLCPGGKGQQDPYPGCEEADAEKTSWNMLWVCFPVSNHLTLFSVLFP